MVKLETFTMKINTFFHILQYYTGYLNKKSRPIGTAFKGILIKNYFIKVSFLVKDWLPTWSLYK